MRLSNRLFRNPGLNNQAKRLLENRVSPITWLAISLLVLISLGMVGLVVVMLVSQFSAEAEDDEHRGIRYLEEGRWEEAESLLRRELDRVEKLHGPNSEKTASALSMLAESLHGTNQLIEAESLYRRALDINSQGSAIDDSRNFFNLRNLYKFLLATNQRSEAEPLMRRALAVEESNLAGGESYFLSYAMTLNELVWWLDYTNRLDEAETLWRESLTRAETLYGPDTLAAAAALNNLAQILQATDRRVEAEPLMRRALGIWERLSGPGHIEIGVGLRNLAQLLVATNRLTDAEPLIRRALTIFETHYGTEHEDVAVSLNNLARLLDRLDRRALAEPLHRRTEQLVVRCGRAWSNEQPHLLRISSNYPRLIYRMDLAATETPQQRQPVVELDGPLTSILPEVERLLGPARPVKAVLAKLDENYRKENKQSVYLLKLDEPISPHLAAFLDEPETDPQLPETP